MKAPPRNIRPQALLGFPRNPATRPGLATQAGRPDSGLPLQGFLPTHDGPGFPVPSSLTLRFGSRKTSLPEGLPPAKRAPQSLDRRSVGVSQRWRSAGTSLPEVPGTTLRSRVRLPTRLLGCPSVHCRRLRRPRDLYGTSHQPAGVSPGLASAVLPSDPTTNRVVVWHQEHPLCQSSSECRAEPRSTSETPGSPRDTDIPTNIQESIHRSIDIRTDQ